MDLLDKLHYQLGFITQIQLFDFNMRGLNLLDRLLDVIRFGCVIVNYLLEGLNLNRVQHIGPITHDIRLDICLLLLVLRNDILHLVEVV